MSDAPERRAVDAAVDSDGPAIGAAPPHDDSLAAASRLAEMATGHWRARAVQAAAELGLADELAGGPRSCDELARLCSSEPQPLSRLLRTLAALGIVREEGGRFALTSLGEPLRSDAPTSVRAFVRFLGAETYEVLADLEQAIRTGRTPFERRFGEPFFDYLANHPDAGRLFDDAMADRHRVFYRGIPESYEFRDVKVVVDVGGGQGQLLGALLRAHPHLHGVLIDQPHVVARARRWLKNAGVSERVRFVAGDFFVDVPEGGDLYLLAAVLHDWDDERALRILRGCQRAMSPAARIVVAEVVGPPEGSLYALLLDLHIMSLTPGRVRGVDDLRALMAAAGLDLTRVLPTGSRLHLVEGVPRR